MKAKTEEYAFHKINDLMWRLGILEDGHSKNITNSEYQQWIRNLNKDGYICVKSEEAGQFQVWGREVEVDI